MCTLDTVSKFVFAGLSWCFSFFHLPWVEMRIFYKYLCVFNYFKVHYSSIWSDMKLYNIFSIKNWSRHWVSLTFYILMYLLLLGGNYNQHFLAIQLKYTLDTILILQIALALILSGLWIRRVRCISVSVHVLALVQFLSQQMIQIDYETDKIMFEICNLTI